MKRKEFIQKSALMGMSFPMFQQIHSDHPSKDLTGFKIQDSELYLPEISELRRLANVVPGDFPKKINVTKVADTIRPGNVVVKGSDPDKTYTLARTVYQFEYSDGNIMLDSGMDLETHRTFGKTEEPYYQDNFDQVNRALSSAKMILLSHYHADHSAGVIRNPNFEEIAHKVWVSKETASLLVQHPHKPTVQTTWEKVNQFIVTDFNGCYPLAPGILVFKTPGHTPDSKMLYIQLQDGTEFIHSVDSGWSMDNIVKERMKNASWVHENQDQLQQQYEWLNQVMESFPNIIVLCTHDNEQYNSLREKGILGKNLSV